MTSIIVDPNLEKKGNFDEDDDQGETDKFYEILNTLKKGNYGKNMTDDDLLGEESIDFNESLGALSDLDGMK